MISNVPSKAMKFRSKIIMTGVFSLLFAAVAVNFFKLSVIDNEKYQAMANEMHFGSIKISAHRGSIYDAEGTPLAKSASVYKIYLDPKRFKEEMLSLQSRIDRQTEQKKNGTYSPVFDEDGKQLDLLPSSAAAFRQDAANLLASKLGITLEDVNSAMEADNQYSILQDQVEKPVADEVLAFFNQYGLTCLNVEEDTKRYYPQNELAASVIGFTSADGNGAYGLEAYYNDYLSGVDGKTISAKDSSGNELPYRYAKTYPAENGNDLYLTIDMDLQYYLEKHLEEMVTQYEVKNRACAILMNAKTGGIYGMATYPSFDLNNPYNITDEAEAARIAQLTGDEAKTAKAEAREAQWKNKCITEIYEPGSVFKVITSSAAIEENLINLDNDCFYCSGGMTIPGAPRPINCHNTSGHGSQNFYQALTNSCNPAFMQIGERLGIDKFCYYFDAFGLGEVTGIDLPGECTGIHYLADDMSNVDLAVCSFGQGNTLTPMEMITSYCAVINGGYLLQPYVVDKVVDEDGNVVLNNERTVRRQVISEDTSAKMRNALERVVTDSSGGNVTIKGYSIGGKSGTSQRLSLTGEDDEKQEYASSYVCFTPADDPELILLVMADMPNKEIGYYGSVVAVPTARNILVDVLQEMGYYPEYTDEEVANLDVKIPLLEGSLSNAIATVEGLGVSYEVIGDGTEVVAQSPITGSSISKDGCVYLYTETNNTEYTEVPDFKGMTASWANDAASMYGLNFVATGASTERDDSVVSKQSIEPGAKVPKGTVVELEFMVYQNSD
ncbi:MAG: penicillin-binding transpeptidase domain-containing protein [Ruminococcus sp.]